MNKQGCLVHTPSDMTLTPSNERRSEVSLRFNPLENKAKSTRAPFGTHFADFQRLPGFKQGAAFHRVIIMFLMATLFVSDGFVINRRKGATAE